MVTGAVADHGNRDTAARTAGKLLLLTAAASMAMVAARVASDADQPTLADSLQAIADSRAIYTLTGAFRLISGMALVVAAIFLLRTWIVREHLATPFVPYLLALSGAITLLSGICTIILASYLAPEISLINGTPTADIPAFVEGVSEARWLAGKIGFAVAGLALILAAKYQWQVGGALRKVAPASAIIGVAMQFVWVDAATTMHPIIGAAFFLWLIAMGATLATGLIERLFAPAGRPTEAA
jgi:hypothetical protein